MSDVVRKNAFDLVILDNFSTLGEVEDENSASSFNAIQQFLLQLKVQGVATMLVHHAGKGGDFRGSSKLAATFETIIKLERLAPSVEHGAAAFRVCWDKVRAGGPKRKVREVAAKLTEDLSVGPAASKWDYETADIERLSLKKTDEPVRPSTEWLDEELGDDGVPDDDPISFEKALD